MSFVMGYVCNAVRAPLGKPPSLRTVYKHTRPWVSAPQLLKPIKGFDGVDSTYKEEGGHESGCEIMYL